MPLPENIIILFYWTAPHGRVFLQVSALNTEFFTVIALKTLKIRQVSKNHRISIVVDKVFARCYTGFGDEK